MTCIVGGCDRQAKGRGLCMKHYKRVQRAGLLEDFPCPGRLEFVNPMVCVCAVPDAHPSRDFGMCSVCKRKPLALMQRPLLAVAS